MSIGYNLIFDPFTLDKLVLLIFHFGFLFFYMIGMSLIDMNWLIDEAGDWTSD